MNIKANLFQSFYIWFRLKDETVSQLIGEQTEVNEVKYNTSFDYEKITANKLRLYLDIYLETAQAELLYRCGYQFRLTNPQWDEVFITDAIYPLVSVAIDKSSVCFNALCNEITLALPS